MKPSWIIKPFKALTLEELYQCLQLRSEVFVVEQNCVYLDLDGKDQQALHLLGNLNGQIIATARLFAAGKYFETASIGRVVVGREFRKLNIGHELMEKAIEGISTHFQTSKIEISAQLYLKRFYESHGFTGVGESYLEDDIPHLRMLRN